tara:strand:- start:885 stop:1409 length:525 start_codon:yes stop_codon:yes gene_type:complete
MPYHWSSPLDATQHAVKSNGRAGLQLHITAHNALSSVGFFFMSITAALMALSTLALLDNGVMWIIAAALGTALTAIWVALKASWRSGTMREELEHWIDKVHLRQIDPDGICQVWQANPYWVDVEVQQTGGPVPNYRTLRSGGRTVEIGSFLSEQARPELAQDLQDTFLSAVKRS